ncbi:MAG: preprotein translocase subunit SecG [Bacteroidales bacterium]|nr:preprotein translocase subunit SecG [Bacteroidales bacterium]MBP5538156.1 preprotein translocase subunit SecG [Bacteroidales bacterium]MBQ9877979.1 preprotein translocase subunit SecG [Bacteroidales bacterium]
MNAIFTILVVLIIIAAILLTGVVLLQNGKGEGMASNFVAGNQAFGVRQTADILEKFTWILVAFILVISVVSSFTLGTNGKDVDITNQIENINTQEAPSFPSPVDNSSAPATEVPAAPENN